MTQKWPPDPTQIIPDPSQKIRFVQLCFDLFGFILPGESPCAVHFSSPGSIPSAWKGALRAWLEAYYVWARRPLPRPTLWACPFPTFCIILNVFLHFWIPGALFSFEPPLPGLEIQFWRALARWSCRGYRRCHKTMVFCITFKNQ